MTQTLARLAFAFANYPFYKPRIISGAEHLWRQLTTRLLLIIFAQKRRVINILSLSLSSLLSSLLSLLLLLLLLLLLFNMMTYFTFYLLAPVGYISILSSWKFLQINSLSLKFSLILRRLGSRHIHRCRGLRQNSHNSGHVYVYRRRCLWFDAFWV